MQNEILKPVLDTDEVAVPRYDIVGPNGAVIQQNVELRLKNEVVQEGTPYDEESVLPASLREQLDLPQSATPAEAMAALLTKGGGAVRRNRPPQTTDADQVGKLWVVPKMVFNNLMPNALTQVAGNWQSSNAAVAVSGNTATFTGNGTENSVYAQVGMLTSAKAGDKVFVQATVRVNHDANAATIQLTCGEKTLATKTLEVPAAGDTMLLQAVVAAESDGALVLRAHSAYNTAAVQSGKGLTVSAITVWNLTADMCEAQEGNEFTEQEAANYISSFGRFQSREYEYSTWWWVLHGVTNGSYLWHRMYDYATAEEAQAGTDDTKLMSALKTQQFLTSRLATQAEVNGGTNSSKLVTPSTAAGLFTNKLATTDEAKAGSVDSKWMSPLKAQQFFTNRLATQSEADAGTSTTKAMTPALVKRRANPYFSANVGDVMHTANNAEVETNGAFIKVDGRTIDVNSGYPLLKNTYELGYRIANPTDIGVSGHSFLCSPWSSSSAWVGTSYFFTCDYAQSVSSSYYLSLCIRKSNGAVTRLLSEYACKVVASNNQAVCITAGKLQVKAYVYDANGTQIRAVSLNTSTNGSDVYVYTFGSTVYVLYFYNGNVYGYYSTDNFATFGTSTWAGAAQYTNSKWPWTNNYSPNVSGIRQTSNGDLYLLVTDSSNNNLPYTRMLKSTDLGKNWTVAWSLPHNVESRVPQSNSWFIDGSYVYLNGYYTEKVNNTSYNRQVLLKYQLSNGSYVGQTPQLNGSTDGSWVGFIKNGHAYLAGSYWSYIIKLSDLSMSPWRFQGNYLNGRTSAVSYLTKNGRYWLLGSEYTGYYPTYSESNNALYGGLVVYDTELDKGVYVTGAMPTGTNSHSPYFGGFCEDSEGNVYFPLGYQSSNTFQYSRVCKLDFGKKTLPSLDYAYLKAKEVT